MIKKYKYPIISIFSVLFVLSLWFYVTEVNIILSPLILPSPVKVLDTFIYKLGGGLKPDGSSLLDHLWSSLKIALGGFLAGTIIGVPFGIAMGWYEKFERFFRPLFDMIRPIPALAWIPLMILWLGIGYTSKVGIVFFASVVSATVNSYSGIKRTKDIHLWVAETFGATNRQLLFKVAIPSALPMIFTGLRLALGSSWVALVAAELVASTKGLGYMIQMGRSLGRTDIIIVGMITIGVVGLLMSKILETAQNYFIKGGDQR